MGFFHDSPIASDLAILLVRIGSGLTMLTHGWPKIYNFSTRMYTFSDPIGLGSEISLGLTVFAEFFCSIFLIVGFYTRIALIPLIGTMCTALFIVHWHHGFPKKELPILYLVIFVALFLTGPGKYSIDGKRGSD